MNLITFFLLAAMPMLALAAPLNECYLVVCKVNGLESQDCSVSPSNLSATMPAGFEITAIRSFTTIARSGEAEGRECPRVPRLPSSVSLDTGSMHGAITVSGTLKASGILRFEPSEGGELQFRINPKEFKSGGPFFRAIFATLMLDQSEPTPKVKPPKALQSADCWQAKAEIEATDFSILVGPSSEAGNHVKKLRLRDIHDFQKCQWGGL